MTSESEHGTHPTPQQRGAGWWATAAWRIEGGSRSATIESRATRWAEIAFVLAGAATALLLLGTRVPLAGSDSLGAVAAWLSGAGAGLAFGVAFWVEARRGRGAWRLRLPRAKRLYDVVVLSIAMAMLAYLAITAIANLFQLGFQGLTIDSLGGGVLAGAAVAAMTYAAALAGSRVSTESIGFIATLQLFMGTMASMLGSPDATWWQLHFSQLGNEPGTSGSRFNVALILTGMVLTVLANYVGNDLERGLAHRGVTNRTLITWLSWLFAAIGLCMMVAGLVPDRENIFVHVGAATGMVVVFGVFVWVALRGLVGVPRDLALFSLLVMIGIVVAVLLWVPFGYYNLTGTEFMAAALLFAWLIVFARTTGAYAEGAVEAVSA